MDFEEAEMHHILNVDETNFSLVGSEGGHGDCPANTIMIAILLGQEQVKNKSSMSSSLMLGSNKAGESMHVHIMFASKAKDEANYQINPKWILGIHVILQCLATKKRKASMQ
jgi:hypothetical protein